MIKTSILTQESWPGGAVPLASAGRGGLGSLLDCTTSLLGLRASLLGGLLGCATGNDGGRLQITIISSVYQGAGTVVEPLRAYWSQKLAARLKAAAVHPQLGFTLAAGRLDRVWPDKAVPVRVVWSREEAMLTGLRGKLVFRLHNVCSLPLCAETYLRKRLHCAQIGLEIRPDLVTGSPHSVTYRPTDSHRVLQSGEVLLLAHRLRCWSLFQQHERHL